MTFPFNQRWGLKLWRAAFLEPPRTAPVPGKDALWNRGRELVEGATHCAACHTGRNVAGARKSQTERYRGNIALPGGEKAPAIDHQSLRTRDRDVNSLAFALRTGITPQGDAFGARMGEVVLQGTAYLTEADREAIATYLIDEHDSG